MLIVVNQIVFLGAFGLFTAKLLVDFKLNHPNVHTMCVSLSSYYVLFSNLARRGDAGMIMGGPILREILSIGTVIFAICGTVGCYLVAFIEKMLTLENREHSCYQDNKPYLPYLTMDSVRCTFFLSSQSQLLYCHCLEHWIG
jgi:hypothetical protein